MNYIFTSEAVTEGHPDKVADRIADSILDEIIQKDKFARVACEVVDAKQLVFIFGQITTSAAIDYEKIARQVVKEVGYTKEEYGFDYQNMKVMEALEKQSPDIALGVDSNDKKELGAGDQGFMFGYATDETQEYMPLGVVLSEALARKLTEVRKNGTIPYLRPDGKTQVSIQYENDIPKKITTVLVSTQHDPDISLDTIRNDVIKYVIDPIIPKDMRDDQMKILVNPTGRFVIGGPAGDTGLTGRKIIIDTYGGYARHGGGSFSGKDPTKVDRSASYMMRYVAKNIVASHLARKIEIQVSYAIGISEPISLYVNSYGTGVVSDEELQEIIRKEFPLTPQGIIDCLDLRRPIYKNTSCYGHFGRPDLNLPWERLDRVDNLRKYKK